jgi:glycopeptide antibiotics resistance protein
MYKRLIPAVLLVAYGAFLVKWMVFKDVPLVRIGQLMLNFGGTDGGHPANFVPFATIAPYLMGYKGLIIAGINLAGNVALLVPLGFLIPFVYRSVTWQKSLALAAASGLAIETLQVLLHVGIFDIDDVILNALGFMIGFGVYALIAKMARSMKPKNMLIAAVIAVILAAAAMAYGYQKFPIRLERAPEGGQAAQGRDLCGGTGGNGRIVSAGDSSVVMERNDGKSQSVNFTDRVEINTPAGPGSVSDLKVGDRATLVGDTNPDGSFTANAVFVCSAQGSEAQ